MQLFFQHIRLSLLLCSCFSIATLSAQRTVTELSTGWRFALGERAGAEATYYDDKAWQEVRVPHDYAILGPFSRDNDLQDVRNIQNGETQVNRKTGRTGGLPYYGRAWYRRSFTVKGKGRWFIYFDGAMSEATIFVNGTKVAFQPNGYAAFEIDVTPHVHQGKNILAVQLDAKAHSSRWYPGAGLFRKVELLHTASHYIPLWGTHAIPLLQGEQGIINLTTRICGGNQEVMLQSQLLDAHGHVVAQTINKLKEQDSSLCHQRIVIDKPQLWSPESPYLYRLVQQVIWRGKVVDKQVQSIGIRSVAFRPYEGFFLNGQRHSIQGVCLHHDYGMLGTAVNESALRYRLQLLKDMGCDAIRTSHNLPSSLLAQLCDELGFMLMIEPFDEWDTPKCENGFHRYFDKYADDLVRQMVRHFRNHPSVVLWGIGNEVPNQRDENGWKLVQHFQQICHEEDASRSVTVCMDQIPYVLKNGFEREIDIPGINYNTQNYPQAYAQWRQHIILGSETASTVSSRGVYKFPVQLREMAMYDDHQSSSYDVEYCSWSNTPDTDFALADDNPWYAGQFVWTGFDYLGEPTPYNNDSWPSHSSVFGIIDLANIPKDRYYLYRSKWNRQAHTLHVLPHWTWPGREGLITPVMVYTDYPEAELFVNGRSMGRQRKLSATEVVTSQHDPLALLRRYRLIWDNVKYEPGQIQVVAYDSMGRATLNKTIKTAGAPHHLVVETINDTISQSDGNLAFLRVSVVDKEGQLCPDDNRLVSFSVSGVGRYVAAANGDPTDLHQYHLPQMPLFHGQLMAAVSTLGRKGIIRFTAQADGIAPCTFTLITK